MSAKLSIILGFVWCGSRAEVEPHRMLPHEGVFFLSYA